MPETRYWFPSWGVLCDKYGSEYYVINGGWGFFYDESTKLRCFDIKMSKLVNATTSDKILVTKEQFNKLEPNFGYWEHDI